MTPLTVRLLALGAVAEAATGVVLMTYPAMFIHLLMRAELSGAGIALGRLTGFALLALGLACWPLGKAVGGRGTALPAMLTYSVLASLYLLALGVGGETVGVLLWPAVAVHAALALTLVLACAWLGEQP